MSFTIGRASLPVDPSSARWSGDQLTITGWISPTTANDTNHAYALRQQLLGLVNNPDEQVFPCTFSVDPNWDGYYYVNSVNVDGDPGLMEIQGRMPYSITLTRLAAGYSRPMIETVYTLAVRSNALGVAPAVTVNSSFPSSSGVYASETTLAVVGTATCEDGTCSVAATTCPVIASGQTFVAPGDYYKTSARIEIKYGSTWYPMMGQQIPNGIGLNWRISNGFTRLYPTQVSGNGRFTVERYKSGVWAGREFCIQTGAASPYYATADPAGTPLTAKVITNTPAIATIRCSYSYGVYDFTIRQGDSFAEVSLNWPGSSGSWGVACSAVVASTAFTGGLRATANDANGLRYLLSCAQATTTDLVNGRFVVTAAVSQATFQVCPDYQTGAYLTTDTGTRDLFFGMRSERRAVVPR